MEMMYAISALKGINFFSLPLSHACLLACECGAESSC